MEVLNQLWALATDYLNLFYLFTFMFLAYLFKCYFRDWLNRVLMTDIQIVFIVLIIAALVAIPFFIIEHEDWKKILLTYCFGTSLHELIFEWIEKKFFTAKAPVNEEG